MECKEQRLLDTDTETDTDTAGDNHYKENFGDNDNYTNDLKETEIFVALKTGVCIYQP